MLNVLHVTASMSPTWTGPAFAVAELTSELSRQGVGCEIVTTRGYRVGSNPMSPPGVPVHSFDAGLPARLWTAYAKELSRFIDDRAADYDLIHVHEVWHYPGYVALRAAARHQLPCVLSLHGGLSQWGLRQKALKKRIYRFVLQDRMLRNAGVLHAITRAEREQLARLGFATPTVVIPNGVVPASFEALPEPAALTRRFPPLAGKRVVLFLGRLHPVKGLDVLVRSFATIARRFEDAALLLAGPDKFGTRQYLESVLRELGLLDRAVFTGMLTGRDKLAALSCAELLVLSSHTEALGIAALEAMAARLPVVVSEGCGFPEVAERGAGLVVKTDETAIAEAVCRLLADAPLRHRMGEQGRKLVCESYTWQITANQITNLYKSLMAGKPVKGNYDCDP